MMAKVLNLKSLLAAALVCCSIDVTHSALTRAPRTGAVQQRLAASAPMSPRQIHTLR